MKRFILHTAATLILAGILLEVILRIFQLSSHVPEEANVNGDRMMRPGIEGIWVSGGLGEIRGHYVINDQGWNSVVDYRDPDTSKVRVAIIGDSYIEGFHVDAEQSVGRLLEGISPEYQVREYGKSGANVADYARIYEKWVRGRYDYTFVWLSDDDLLQHTANFMDQGENMRELSWVRKAYYSSCLLRYFGLNHKMGARVRESLSRGEHEAPGGEDEGPGVLLTGDDFLASINREAVSVLDGSVVYLYDRGRLREEFTSGHECLLIDHRLQPADFGFDAHWNLNGRKNVASTLHEYILAEVDQEINCRKFPE
jgi:hypothetical protein